MDLDGELSVVSDLFRCQEDVKPLRVFLVCLLKERGRKSCFVLFVFDLVNIVC